MFRAAWLWLLLRAHLHEQEFPDGGCWILKVRKHTGVLSKMWQDLVRCASRNCCQWVACAKRRTGGLMCLCSTTGVRCTG